MREQAENGNVKLLKAEPSSLTEFKSALQDSFRVAAEVDFGGHLKSQFPLTKILKSLSVPREPILTGLWQPNNELGGLL